MYRHWDPTNVMLLPSPNPVPALPPTPLLPTRSKLALDSCPHPLPPQSQSRSAPPTSALPPAGTVGVGEKSETQTKVKMYLSSDYEHHYRCQNNWGSEFENGSEVHENLIRGSSTGQRYSTCNQRGVEWTWVTSSHNRESEDIFTWDHNELGWINIIYVSFSNVFFLLVQKKKSLDVLKVILLRKSLKGHRKKHM